MSRFSLHNVTVGYGDQPVVRNATVELPDNRVSTFIGPNGCGKSTLLKTMCSLLDYSGSVMLGGREIKSIPRRERAQSLTLLPQSPTAPDGLSVYQLISRGRHPYQGLLGRWSTSDEEAVQHAIATTQLEELQDRPVGDLSGGQRQRVWIAMTLAQDASTMLLDEPTTYLDLAHSLEVLRLVRAMQEEENRTVIMVLHDLNLAARFSDHIVAIGRDGQIAATGTPAEVLTEETLAATFGLSALVTTDPVSGGPLIVPR